MPHEYLSIRLALVYQTIRFASSRPTERSKTVTYHNVLHTQFRMTSAGGHNVGSTSVVIGEVCSANEVKVKVEVYSMISCPMTHQPTADILTHDQWTCSFLYHFNSTESIQSCNHYTIAISVLSFTPESSKVCEVKVPCPRTQYPNNVTI